MQGRVLSIAVATSALAAAPGLAVARPVTLSCGTTVTHSVTLAAAVECPAGFSGAGLTIGADDVTLNLNGYGVQGQNSAEQSAGSVGVLDVGHHFVTIDNGGIDGFDTDLHLQGGGESRASRLTLESESPDPALLVQGGQRFTVADATVENQDKVSIEILNSPETDVIATHVASVNASDDIDVQSRDDLLRQVSATGEGMSVLVAGSHNELLDDQAPASEIASGNDNVIDGGTFGPSMLTGLTIESAAVGTTVNEVRADGNQLDGIDVDSQSTLLLHNSADDNLGYGIDAVPGVAASGNQASGNSGYEHPALQCINVSCSS